ncbi:hypothetical protein ACKWTF_004912 [Chironomus riparius]
MGTSKNMENSVDNRKPIIRDCKSYAPSIKEEQPHSTYVTRIDAYDPDKQDRIDFGFIMPTSERPKFKIDPASGIITTNHIFDRDEPAREKEIYLTVRVTDNGRPPLEDICTFKVTIEDINDNPPVFDKSKYSEPLPEDRQVKDQVMRISATDLDDGEFSVVRYKLLDNKPHAKYFHLDNITGVLTLARPIDKKPGQWYTINVQAYNIKPDENQLADTEVKIEVIESSKKAPTFVDPPNDPIILKENFNQFEKKLVTLSAKSNVPEKPDLIFELLTGRTEQTNSKKTFVLYQNGNDASILLGKALDYEVTTDYSLTVIVKNSHNIMSEHNIKIKVEDVNDNIPSFVEVDTGTILENEPPGTQVMIVRAIDNDATSPFNAVTFELADNNEIFQIDPITGVVTAKQSLDRESQEFYNVKIAATDGAPSALFTTGKPNSAAQVFRIEVADKNDHPPQFKQDEYLADRIPEDSNKNALVIEVTAIDPDTASNIEYSIESGNIDDSFEIDKTGRITIRHSLDYEKITEYSLKIKAFDGIYSDFATVKITVANVNDCPPVFIEEEYRSKIDEEKIHPDCIFIMNAYDPDIKDRNLDQHIRYEISKKEQRDLLTIDAYGCLRNIKPLDRDKPNGHKEWQILVTATDEDGQGLSQTQTVIIILNDINDNAPFLSMNMPIVWPENHEPGIITSLLADDYDEKETNGYRYEFELWEHASNDIKNKFSIENSDQLVALASFDREAQKEYFIPINISDGGEPRMSNVSYLHLIIGDVNDNEMKEGSSSIFVYNYKGEAPDTEIGRVYVDDPDDWDLPDKNFFWQDGKVDEHFSLDENTGMITMIENTGEGIYSLEFRVVETMPYGTRHDVTAYVQVTVKEIPEEAVDKSGSIRFVDISAEKFVDDGNSISPKEKLQDFIMELFNVSRENVDIFTVLKNDRDSAILDVRFSAHGSPYYEPEKLNGKILQHKNKLEEKLGSKVMMINIDECLIEKAKCESSCMNVLEKSNIPLSVYTNRTSFVGVNAFVRTECKCFEPKHGEPVCYNGGTSFANTCECPKGFEGPNCQQITVGFSGNSWALYPPIDPCDSTKISLELKPENENGLVLYVGPMSYMDRLPISDFLALELVDGYPVLIVDYGTGAVRIHHNYTKLETGRFHVVDILLTKTSAEMTVDNCKLSDCMSLRAPQGKNEFLNVNAPIHLGGSSVNLDVLRSAYNWTYAPTMRGYIGCIKNLTINDFTYNLGQPSLAQNVDPGCERSLAAAVTFGVASNFIYALIGCILLLIILILAVVVHKKSYDGWHEKDMDDIRETIINYEDEGGGERDTDYDLNVLRGPPIYEDKLYKDLRQKEAHEVPDIGAFLIDKKDACDKDNDAYPVDDVRHYAYEGDGNSSGSLSSLASCTDDGDLKFNYLSNFGPRFRKLADMYGEEPSDTDSNVDADEGWRI